MDWQTKSIFSPQESCGDGKKTLRLEMQVQLHAYSCDPSHPSLPLIPPPLCSLLSFILRSLLSTSYMYLNSYFSSSLVPPFYLTSPPFSALALSSPSSLFLSSPSLPLPSVFFSSLSLSSPSLLSSSLLSPSFLSPSVLSPSLHSPSLLFILPSLSLPFPSLFSLSFLSSPSLPPLSSPFLLRPPVFTTHLSNPARASGRYRPRSASRSGRHSILNASGRRKSKVEILARPDWALFQR